MAWKIDFNKKVGEMVYCGMTVGIYDSNGYMAVYDLKTSKIDGYVYETPLFRIINEDHLRNLLGLNPEHPNYLEGKVTKVRLYRRKCKNAWQIGTLFKLAMPDLDIEITDD